MKKLIYPLLFILLLTLAGAQDTKFGKVMRYDFEGNDQLVMDFNKGDLLRYTVDGKEHKLIVDKINPVKKSVEFTVYFEGRDTPFYPAISTEDALRLDFDRDHVTDMNVTIQKIAKDKVKLLFQRENIQKNFIKKGSENADDKTIEKEPDKTTIQQGAKSLIMSNKDKFPPVIASLVIVLYIMNRRETNLRIKRFLRMLF
jgi:hypothetical protein